MKSFINKYGVYLLSAFLFIAASAIYAFPVLQGKVLNNTDNTNAICAASEASYYTKTTGRVTWWCDSMFSGMPNYQINGGQYRADRMLGPLRSVLLAGHNNMIWALLTFFVCFFLLMLSLGTDKWLSIVGAFALTLSSYFIIIVGSGHATKASTIAMMAAVLASFFWMLRGKYGLGAVVCLICSVVSITVHPQMSYYIFMMIGLLWLFLLPGKIKEKKFKSFMLATAIFVACVGVGLAANSSSVFANTEYVEETVRGGGDNTQEQGFVTSFSYSPLESFSLLIPGVCGGSSSIDLGTKSNLYKTMMQWKVTPKNARDYCARAQVYWGSQPFTQGNVYAGAIICFLFLLGLLVVKGPLKWGLLTATIFSILLAMGDSVMPITKFFINYFPLYSKFRAVSSILIVAEIAMPMLGVLAVQAAMNGTVGKDKLLRSVFISAAVTAGICLLFALIGPSVLSFKADADKELELQDILYRALIADRKAMLVKDSFRSAGFIVAAAIVLISFLKGHLKKELMIVGLGLLIVVDLWAVDKRYINDSYFTTARNYGANYAMKEWEMAIEGDDSFFRVYNGTLSNPFSEARTSLYNKSIGGYNAAKLKRYQDLIDDHLVLMHDPVLNMLNTKYVIAKNEAGEPEVLYNRRALGNAWFVDNCVIAEDDKEESAALMEIDLATTAVVGKDFAKYAEKVGPTTDPERVIFLGSHTPDSRVYEFESDSPETVVFSEIWYPHGWKSYIDGKRASHFRADYTLRAMNIPAGRHTIKFVFDPDSIKKGDALAVPFVILLYLAVIGIIVAAVIVRLRSASRQRRQA